MISKAEKKKLQQMLRAINTPSATAATFGLKGYVSSHLEARRLLQSADYKAGYNKCADTVRACIEDLGIEEEKYAED